MCLDRRSGHSRRVCSLIAPILHFVGSGIRQIRSFVGDGLLNVAGKFLHLGKSFTSLLLESLLTFLNIIRLITILWGAGVGAQQAEETNSHQGGCNGRVAYEPPGEACSDRKSRRRIGSGLGLD